MSEEIIIVSEPSFAGLRNTQLLFESIAKSKASGTILNYVINFVGQNAQNEVSEKDFSQILGVSPIGAIPWNASVFKSASENGHMISQEKKTANVKISGLFDNIALLVVARGEVDTKTKKKKGKGNFIDKIKDIFSKMSKKSK